MHNLLHADVHRMSTHAWTRAGSNVSKGETRLYSCTERAGWGQHQHTAASRPSSRLVRRSGEAELQLAQLLSEAEMPLCLN